VPENAARRHPAVHGEDAPAGVEEEDIELEAHAEGVDAGAARDQQTRAGDRPIPPAEAEQTGSEILRNGKPP
jgi:hypothetical protein